MFSPKQKERKAFFTEANGRSKAALFCLHVIVLRLVPGIVISLEDNEPGKLGLSFALPGFLRFGEWVNPDDLVRTGREIWGGKSLLFLFLVAQGRCVVIAMAVAENAGVDIGSSARDLGRAVVTSDLNPPRNYSSGNDAGMIANGSTKVTNLSAKDQNNGGDADGDDKVGQQLKSNGVRGQKIMGVVKNGGYENGVMMKGGVRNIEELAEMLTKLNPMAAEFVPLSFATINGYRVHGRGFGYGVGLREDENGSDSLGYPLRRRRNSYQSKPRINNRTSLAQRKEIIMRTVYVSDIDQQVTEEQLAALFNTCGQVVDCRVCGDPNSCLRFAFIEFIEEEGALAALSLSGMMLGFYPVRVMPSKTAIAPVNPTLLPRSDDEREMCSRTVYCANIDWKVTQADVKIFFESLCGEVQRLRLLGDYKHPTRIAFVEFVMAESAIAALSCSGAILGSFPIRVSPSKTPVRPRIPRPQMR